MLVENHERKKVVGEKNKKNKTGLKKKERVPICQEKKKTSFGEKKKNIKKKGLKKKERVPICQEKKKASFVKATDAGGAPRWCPEFE